MLGSIARRSGRDAARQRIASTAAVATAATRAQRPLGLVDRVGGAGVREDAEDVALLLEQQHPDQLQHQQRERERPRSAASRRGTAAGPPLRLVSTSGRNAKIQMSEMNMATVAASGASIWVSSG